MTARIKPLEAPYSEELETALKKMMPPNAAQEPLKLFRVLAKHLELMNRMRPLGAGILGHGLISPREREIIILRTCANCGAEYEWGIHATAFGEMVGLSESEIMASFRSDKIWNLRESVLIDIVDELDQSATISNVTWEKTQEFWDEAQVIEIIVIVGWYHTIAYLCNATHVPLETWAARFPKN